MRRIQHLRQPPADAVLVPAQPFDCPQPAAGIERQHDQDQPAGDHHRDEEQHQKHAQHRGQPAADFAQRAGWLVLLCLVLSPLGFTLIQRGPLYLPSAEVALLMLLESVFGILWVWWVLDESLTPRGWVGGAMVLGAMLIKSLIDRRLRHLQATRTPSADASAGGN